MWAKGDRGERSWCSDHSGEGLSHSGSSSSHVRLVFPGLGVSVGTSRPPAALPAMTSGLTKGEGRYSISGLFLIAGGILFYVIPGIKVIIKILTALVSIETKKLSRN